MCDNKTVYAQKIFGLAKEKKNELFYNSSMEHAIIVHQAIAQNAEDYIYIYSSSMCTEVSNNPQYCESIDKFLEADKRRRIKVVLTDYNDDFPSKPIALVFAKHPDQVEVKQFEGHVTYNDKHVHFTVSDDRAFRLETDIMNQMAFGNFNSPDQAEDLKNIFEKIFVASERVKYC